MRTSSSHKIVKPKWFKSIRYGHHKNERAHLPLSSAMFARDATPYRHDYRHTSHMSVTRPDTVTNDVTARNGDFTVNLTVNGDGEVDLSRRQCHLPPPAIAPFRRLAGCRGAAHTVCPAPAPCWALTVGPWGGAAAP
mmetsp:Transcript_26034/g.66095  ORF Transcript_26034/g.66095 Transcript_26034/m.66095 type:complete len:137 (+) Transcript_26034:30-440(+)